MTMNKTTADTGPVTPGNRQHTLWLSALIAEAEIEACKNAGEARALNNRLTAYARNKLGLDLQAGSHPLLRQKVNEIYAVADRMLSD